jgi:hypothetical protein
MRRTVWALAAGLCFVTALGGCRREADEGAEGAPAAGVADSGVLDGLSREEIERQAEAMTPEQAEKLGIVDTTIHLEQLTSPDDSAVVPDTLRRDTGAAPRRP